MPLTSTPFGWGAPASRSRPARVLWGERDGGLREGFQRCLVRTGYVVVTTDTAGLLMRILRASLRPDSNVAAFDLFVTDLFEGPTCAIGISQEARQADPELPIFWVVRACSPSLVAAAEEVDAILVERPVRANDLAAMVGFWVPATLTASP